MQWYLKLNYIIMSFGFKANIVDRYIYLKVGGSKFIILILYVDDILLSTNNLGQLSETKKFFSNNFEMKDISKTYNVIGDKFSLMQCLKNDLNKNKWKIPLIHIF